MYYIRWPDRYVSDKNIECFAPASLSEYPYSSLGETSICDMGIAVNQILLSFSALVGLSIS